MSKVYDKKRKIPRDIFYAQYNNGKFAILMHRYIVNAQKGEFVDHINHNELDNRKSNLRLCTKNQNAMNILLPITNKSGHKGVYYDVHLKIPRWKAFIKYEQRFYHLGYYDDYNEAVIAREKAERKYFGDYSSNDSVDLKLP